MKTKHITVLSEPELDAIATKVRQFRSLRRRLRQEEIAANLNRIRQDRTEPGEEVDAISTEWESP